MSNLEMLVPLFRAVRLQAEMIAHGSTKYPPLPYVGPGYMPWWFGYPNHPGKSFGRFPEKWRRFKR